ncbi:hypothetical protein BDV96DRAFT_589934 [Lophiotrema nucula]|uniref:Peptidase M20 dimerisation domain-containing protein n=1 Tax=Lophiotrema nucula TaxID=690887 RepID=A0A6A5YJR3_9PLEO|nr:hypothetical protein BDV96DRAFT_589934 [Lophiotrema nucula]
MDSTFSALRSIIKDHLPDLKRYEDIYKDLHAHPELGTLEKRTSSIATKHLREIGYEVTKDIGGHGVTGVFENGAGPTVMLRADMDALPIREQTGLVYASTLETVDTDGEKKPVMHACGHDSHVSTMMATAELLCKSKEHWTGTLIILFQPDEEHCKGAQAMIDDGLYNKIPKPNIVLGQHLTNAKAGTVLLRKGVFLASADTFKVTVFGRGAHGAQPQESIDPIVIASSIVMRLQTVVAREIGPEDVATVTCASFEGGSWKAPNIIPDQVVLTLNIRTFDSTVRGKVLHAVKRIIKHEALASGAPREPTIQELNSYPLTYNDPDSVQKLHNTFEEYFREDCWVAERETASEDFTNFATHINVPSIFWNFGGVNEEIWEKYEQDRKEGKKVRLPGAHQADYAPVLQPTLKTGIEAMSLAALTFMGKSEKKSL